MTRAEYRVRSRVWLYRGMARWHSANVTPKQSAEIRGRFGGSARGFGSLRVDVKIGRTAWKTSIFPDRRSDSHLFAIKADVRKKEHISAGDTVNAVVRIR